MSKIIPDDIIKDLEKACALHQRAVSDYDKCVEFNKLMALILARAEDGDDLMLADKVMGILLDCNPKEGTHCEKATLVGEKMKKILKKLG